MIDVMITVITTVVVVVVAVVAMIVVAVVVDVPSLTNLTWMLIWIATWVLLIIKSKASFPLALFLDKIKKKREAIVYSCYVIFLCSICNCW
jgi:hypothetical protein